MHNKKLKFIFNRNHNEKCHVKYLINLIFECIKPITRFTETNGSRLKQEQPIKSG